MKRQLNNMTQVNLTWAVNATSCYNWNDSQTNIAEQLALLEAMFACSGWCNNNQTNLYYLFTNINQGKPNGFCYSILLSFFDKFGQLVQISSFSVSAILLVVIGILICLCMHPSKRKNDEGELSSLKERLLMLSKSIFKESVLEEQ